MAFVAGGLLFSSCGKNYSITVNVNNEGWGTVTGTGTYAENAVVTIAATPNAGYSFVKWNDGSTENPRQITVVENATYTAYFEAIPVEPTVNVTFDGAAWSAGAIVGAYFPTTTAWDVLARQTEGSMYPSTEISVIKNTTGTVSENCNENGSFVGDINWVEYYKQTYLVDADNNPYGDWWAKSATINISAFDATALTMSSTTTAVMFDASAALVEGGVGIDAAPTANMAVNMTNIALEAKAASKAPVKSFKNLRVAK